MLISHGSRLHYGEEVINQVAEIYRKKLIICGCKFYEHVKPSIPAA